MNKAEQLIACLEGEIAKRDETIARLEPQLNRAIQANYDLREELASIKAQEPVPDEREEFDKWFRKTQLIADSVDTTFVNPAFLPYKAWMARARLNAAHAQQVSVPDGATLILGDTGRKDLDRLIDRLMSSDPDFEDCTAAAALLRRLFMEEISGPKGHATWKDAAVAERLRRVSMRPSETVVAMAREGLAVYSGPNMNEHKVCAEIVRLADISDTAMLAAPAADAGHVFYGMDGNHP